MLCYTFVTGTGDPNFNVMVSSYSFVNVYFLKDREVISRDVASSRKEFLKNFRLRPYVINILVTEATADSMGSGLRLQVLFLIRFQASTETFDCSFCIPSLVLW